MCPVLTQYNYGMTKKALGSMHQQYIHHGIVKDAIKSTDKTCTSARLLELAPFMEDMAAQKTCQLNGSIIIL